MTHWTNYSYSSQNGKLYNEIYTYDKEWNAASEAEMKSNPQRVTGINLNNWWIQKYGEDFFPYRAQGWHDQLWRRPNQRRAGGIQIPNAESSPNEYTNGSHPRRWYVGNRYVFMCGHCTRSTSVGLVTGNVIFYNTNGEAITYDVENYDPENESSAFVINPLTGTPAWGDGQLVRLTTDPADDGIPEIKQRYLPSVQPYKGQMICLTGYSVIMPCYRSQGSFGGKLGGKDKIVWSGSSGTMFFIETNDGWKYHSISGSGDLPMEGMRLLTGDNEYQDIEFTRKSYYVMEQSDVSRYTFGRNAGLDIDSSGVELSVTAINRGGSDTKVSNTLDVQIVDGVAPIISTDPGFGVDSIYILTGTGVSGATYYHYYNEEISNTINYRIDTDLILSNSESVDPVDPYFNIVSRMQNGTLIGDGNSAYSTEEFDFFVGQTFEADLTFYNQVGSDSATAGNFYVRGITGITGPGPSYSGETYSSGINEGTALELGEPGITVSHLISIAGEAIIISGNADKLDFNLNDAVSPTGASGDSFIIATSIDTPYNPVKENLSLVFNGILTG